MWQKRAPKRAAALRSDRATGRKKPKTRAAAPAAAAAPTYIFLDIDGVLAPFGGRSPPPRPAVEDVSEVFAPFDADCLARLARLVDASGGARVVLSSSWRASPAAVAAVRERFRAFGAPLAREPLDLATDPRRHEPRQWEIARWLDRRRAAAANWVALDDEDLVDGPENRERRDLFAERAVLVASDRGFSEGDLARAMEILGCADAAAAAAPG